MIKHRFWPKVIWKNTLYATSGSLNNSWLQRAFKRRILKGISKNKGNEGSILMSIYGWYLWRNGLSSILISYTKNNVPSLKIETLLHEILHHLTTKLLPATLEHLVDDLIDILL